MKISYRDIEPYTTKDGSVISELVHPARTEGCRNQSLAEAIVLPLQETLLHRHKSSEEIYHFIAGQGKMTLGAATFDVAGGDTVLIAAGTAHKVRNTGDSSLKILCACAPPYAHDDTELL